MVASKMMTSGKHVVSTPAHDSSPPPAYAQGNHDIPDITTAFSTLNLKTSTKPTPDVCLAHLKLLEALNQLREDVAYEDGRFDIKDEFANAGKSDRERSDLLAKIREKRWQVYVTKASKRFERWWSTCVEPGDEATRLLKQDQIPSIFQQTPEIGERLEWTKDQMPPLGKYHQDYCLPIRLY